MTIPQNVVQLLIKDSLSLAHLLLSLLTNYCLTGSDLVYAVVTRNRSHHLLNRETGGMSHKHNSIFGTRDCASSWLMIDKVELYLSLHTEAEAMSCDWAGIRTQYNPLVTATLVGNGCQLNTRLTK